MPPVNRARHRREEDRLAQRIAYERTRRGWSYAGLANRMSGVGCALDQSAFHKIEKAERRRRGTVDELAALSEVFDIPISELLEEPPMERVSRIVSATLVQLRHGLAEFHRLQGELSEPLLKAMMMLAQLEPEKSLPPAFRHQDESLREVIGLMEDTLRRLENGELADFR